MEQQITSQQDLDRGLQLMKNTYMKMHTCMDALAHEHAKESPNLSEINRLETMVDKLTEESHWYWKIYRRRYPADA